MTSYSKLSKSNSLILVLPQKSMLVSYLPHVFHSVFADGGLNTHSCAHRNHGISFKSISFWFALT